MLNRSALVKTLLALLCWVSTAQAQNDSRFEQHHPVNKVQEDSLFVILQSVNCDGYFVAPNIPEGKLVVARKACQVDEQDKVYAFLDLTVFGKAKHCVLFTSSGLYINNSNSSDHPGRYFISYETLKLCDIGSAYLEVNVGTTSIDISGSSINQKQLIALLQRIKAAL